MKHINLFFQVQCYKFIIIQCARWTFDIIENNSNENDRNLKNKTIHAFNLTENEKL